LKVQIMATFNRVFISVTGILKSELKVDGFLVLFAL